MVSTGQRIYVYQCFLFSHYFRIKSNIFAFIISDYCMQSKIKILFFNETSNTI